MQLQRLKLTNFRQHAQSEIVFGDGITAIIGPNGSGKTTLLEAVAWAFYGSPAARGSRDSIRWNRAPARSAVKAEVEFGLGAHEYRVVRTLYGAELYQDRATSPIANSQQEVTATVQRILGMSRDEFFNTYFTGQKELAVMAAMGPTERAKFLSKIVGYERLRLAQDKLRGTRAGLRGELDGLERVLSDPKALEQERGEKEARAQQAEAGVSQGEETLAHAVRQRDVHGPVWTEMVRIRESVIVLDGDRRVAEKDVIEARRDFERLDKELAEALSAQSQLEGLEPGLQEIGPLREELVRVEREARDADQRRLLSGQLAEARAQVERLVATLGTLGTPDRDLSEAQQADGDAQDQVNRQEAAETQAHDDYVRAKQDAETKRLTLRDQYRDLQADRESIVEAGPDGVCPTCSRTLGEEFESVLESLIQQLEQVEMNGKFFKQRVEQLAVEPEAVLEARRQLAEARAALDQVRQQVADARSRQREAQKTQEELREARNHVAEIEREISRLPATYDAESLDRARERIRELEPTLTRATELRVKAERAEQLVREAEEAERDLTTRENRVTELTERIDALGFDEEGYAAARAEYEAAERAVRDAELGLLEGQGELKAARESLASVLQRLEERAQQAVRATEVRDDLRVHDELDSAFTDLRTELNTQLRPELSEIASAFLSDLTDGRYHELELDEQYQIMVLEDGEPKPVISGGEEDIANLVLRLAISQMVAERAGQPLSLLVLDEIFGSLDEIRRQHVVTLLRRLADRFPQVVLITHIESVRDTVDRVLRVSLDGARGAAVVTEDAGGSDENVAA